MNNLIDDILTDWSYRVSDGMPNPKNQYHLIHLKESMKHLKVDNEIVDIVMNHLYEVKKSKPHKDIPLVKQLGGQNLSDEVIEDIIKGFWQVSEDLYYDKLWKQEEDKKFVDPTPDDPQWLNDKGSDSDRIHYKLH